MKVNNCIVYPYPWTTGDRTTPWETDWTNPFYPDRKYVPYKPYDVIDDIEKYFKEQEELLRTQLKNEKKEIEMNKRKVTLEDNKFEYQFIVAGFKEDEIDITLNKDNILTIIAVKKEGSKNNSFFESKEYSTMIPNKEKVLSGHLEDGILFIITEKEPEKDTSQKLNITKRK